MQTVVAVHKYGSAENYVAGQQAGWTTHMGDVLGKQNHADKPWFLARAVHAIAAEDGGGQRGEPRTRVKLDA